MLAYMMDDLDEMSVKVVRAVSSLRGAHLTTGPVQGTNCSNGWVPLGASCT